MPLPLTEPARKLWSRSEVERLQAIGFFEGERFELIDGELINKMGQLPPHTQAILIGHEWLAGVFSMRRVRAQLPVEVSPSDYSKSLPEPDFAVTVADRVEFSRRHPQPSEVCLIIEVADTSLGMDLGRKAVLYARAGFADYWVLDLNGRRLVVHRKPVNGKYSLITSYAETEEVAPLAAPEATIQVADLFPKSGE